MNISLYNISKNQTLIIKAFAIIGIVFHNFLHSTNDIGENQMEFTPERIYDLFFFLKENPLQAIDALFSYFGHYGVQLFIFCSGYGLSKQFIKNKPASYKTYVIPRLTKIYSLLLFGIISCAILYVNYFAWYIKISATYLLTIFRNISNDYLFDGIGPWWYFGLVVQLYLLFPFLYKIIQKYQEKGVYISLLISYLLIFTLSPLAEKLNFPIYGNCIGHFPEFLVGIRKFN